MTGLEDVASSCARGGSGWISERIHSQKELSNQGGGGVSIPGSVQEKSEHGTLSAIV